eukprot:TRINITY_DN8135_c0_g1_i3.p1 TRINITY_DN8135_c0_g1~~TRINITY_DN8135_c0_g1_i3.p1  ORF type:complete len:840 (+),score=140.60 TRINITY_DN8135_c0_g1_i3:116-2635(+)
MGGSGSRAKSPAPQSSNNAVEEELPPLPPAPEIPAQHEWGPTRDWGRKNISEREAQKLLSQTTREAGQQEGLTGQPPWDNGQTTPSRSFARSTAPAGFHHLKWADQEAEEHREEPKVLPSRAGLEYAAAAAKLSGKKKKDATSSSNPLDGPLARSVAGNSDLPVPGPVDRGSPAKADFSILDPWNCNICGQRSISPPRPACPTCKRPRGQEVKRTYRTADELTASVVEALEGNPGVSIDKRRHGKPPRGGRSSAGHPPTGGFSRAESPYKTVGAPSQSQSRLPQSCLKAASTHSGAAGTAFGVGAGAGLSRVGQSMAQSGRGNGANRFSQSSWADMNDMGGTAKSVSWDDSVRTTHSREGMSGSPSMGMPRHAQGRSVDSLDEFSRQKGTLDDLEAERMDLEAQLVANQRRREAAVRSASAATLQAPRPGLGPELQKHRSFDTFAGFEAKPAGNAFGTTFGSFSGNSPDSGTPNGRNVGQTGVGLASGSTFGHFSAGSTAGSQAAGVRFGSGHNSAQIQPPGFCNHNSMPQPGGCGPEPLLLPNPGVDRLPKPQHQAATSVSFGRGRSDGHVGPPLPKTQSSWWSPPGAEEAQYGTSSSSRASPPSPSPLDRSASPSEPQAPSTPFLQHPPPPPISSSTHHEKQKDRNAHLPPELQQERQAARNAQLAAGFPGSGHGHGGSFRSAPGPGTMKKGPAKDPAAELMAALSATAVPEEKDSLYSGGGPWDRGTSSGISPAKGPTSVSADIGRQRSSSTRVTSSKIGDETPSKSGGRQRSSSQAATAPTFYKSNVSFTPTAAEISANQRAASIDPEMDPEALLQAQIQRIKGLSKRVGSSGLA